MSRCTYELSLNVTLKRNCRFFPASNEDCPITHAALQKLSQTLFSQAARFGFTFVVSSINDRSLFPSSSLCVHIRCRSFGKPICIILRCFRLQASSFVTVFVPFLSLLEYFLRFATRVDLKLSYKWETEPCTSV